MLLHSIFADGTRRLRTTPRLRLPSGSVERQRQAGSVRQAAPHSSNAIGANSANQGTLGNSAKGNGTVVASSLKDGSSGPVAKDQQRRIAGRVSRLRSQRRIAGQ